MKIIIAGGSGQVGAILARAFHGEGHELTVLARRAFSAVWRVLPWDGRTLGEWAAVIEGADVVINLAGRSVNCRYTRENMRQMMDSRVESTRVLGEAIAQCSKPPRVWLQMSTATIYSHRYDAANDDVTGQIGGKEPDAPAYWSYSIEIAQAWERAAVQSHTPSTRKVLLRSAMVMSPDRAGIFDVMLARILHRFFFLAL
jgi:NAD dependent epimerase/dehydratase family enzyme